MDEILTTVAMNANIFPFVFNVRLEQLMDGTERIFFYISLQVDIGKDCLPTDS